MDKALEKIQNSIHLYNMRLTNKMNDNKKSIKAIEDKDQIFEGQIAYYK